MDEDSGDKLPALDTAKAWTKTLGIFAALILINVVAFLVSFGAGVIVTLPLTLFLAFLLLRDIAPRHRFPPGRPPQGISR
ncbi:MAG TPA: hypothetical protein VJ385_01990 [Fibrobacteria bacterium]|nr:hypothetical protein [Fibrobacteria bacterium]